MQINTNNINRLLAVSNQAAHCSLTIRRVGEGWVVINREKNGIYSTDRIELLEAFVLGFTAADI